jgi:hypothetical protein
VTRYKQLISKKAMLSAIGGVGILLSTFSVISLLANIIAQQQQQQKILTNEISINQSRTIPRINGTGRGFDARNDLEETKRSIVVVRPYLHHSFTTPK